MPAAFMHPTMQRLYSGYERRLAAVDPSRMQLRTKGDAARWSAQQIVEHLLLTYTATSGNFNSVWRGAQAPKPL